MERSLGYPGYDFLMPRARNDLGNPARQWLQHGMVRENYNVPGWQSSAAGPFDLWPTGLGFDYFYGFIGGDTDQWDPTLFENTAPLSLRKN